MGQNKIGKTNESEKKFITDKTKIEIDENKKTVTFINKYQNGKVEKLTVHYKDKPNVVTDKPDYILQDKEYFVKIIKEMINTVKGSKKEIDGSEHSAKHPNGMINIAKYDAKTNTILQLNNVSEENPKGTSRLKYKLD